MYWLGRVALSKVFLEKMLQYLFSLCEGSDTPHVGVRNEMESTSSFMFNFITVPNKNTSTGTSTWTLVHTHTKKEKKKDQGRIYLCLPYEKEEV